MKPTLAIRSGGSVKEHVNVTVEKCGDEPGGLLTQNFRNDAAAPKRRRKFGRHAEMGVMLHVQDMTLIIISVACETES